MEEEKREGKRHTNIERQRTRRETESERERTSEMWEIGAITACSNEMDNFCMFYLAPLQQWRRVSVMSSLIHPELKSACRPIILKDYTPETSVAFK